MGKLIQIDCNNKNDDNDKELLVNNNKITFIPKKTQLYDRLDEIDDKLKNIYRLMRDLALEVKKLQEEKEKKEGWFF